MFDHLDLGRTALDRGAALRRHDIFDLRGHGRPIRQVAANEDNAAAGLGRREPNRDVLTVKEPDPAHFGARASVRCGRLEVSIL